MLWELRIVAYGFSKAFFPPPASWGLEFADNLLGHAGGPTSLRVRTESVRRLRTPRLPIMPLPFAQPLATPPPGCTQLSGLPSPRAQQTILWFGARIGSKSTVVPSQPDRTMTPCLVVPVRTYTRSCTIAASLRFPPAGWYQIQLPAFLSSRCVALPRSGSWLTPGAQISTADPSIADFAWLLHFSVASTPSNSVRRGTWRDVPSCGFAGAFAGVLLSTGYHAVCRVIGPILGPGILGATILWGAVGLALALVSAPLIPHRDVSESSP